MTTTTALPTATEVNTAKGAELRTLYLAVTGKSTASKDSTRLREQLVAELERRAAEAETSGGVDASDDGVGAAEEPGADDTATNDEGAPTNDDGANDERDARLPAVGTVLVKRDRHGAERCRCQIVDEGVLYADKLYDSLSGAAKASMADLGLTSKTVNGWAWWGVTKRDPKPSAKRDPLAGVNAGWERYVERVKASLVALEGEERKALMLALLANASDLRELAATA